MVNGYDRQSLQSAPQDIVQSGHGVDGSNPCTGVSTSVANPVPSQEGVNRRDHAPISSTSTVSSTFVSPERDDLAQASSVSSTDSDVESSVPLELRQNPRRSSSSRLSTPPSIPTVDQQRHFINGLLTVTKSILETIWPLSGDTPGSGILSLQTFIQETCRRSRTSYSTLQIALYYMILLKQVLPSLDFTREQPRESESDNVTSTDPRILWGQRQTTSGCRVMQCGRRMFMSALMLAAKYLQDRNFSVKAWARISGLSCAEINKNEKAYLQSIEYCLHLKKEHFENWSQIVLVLCRYARAEGSLDYLELIRNLKPEIIRDSDATDHFVKALNEGRYSIIGPRNHCLPPRYRRDDDDNDESSLLRTTEASPAHVEHVGPQVIDKPFSSGPSTHCRVPVASLERCPPPHQPYSSMPSLPKELNVSPPWSSSVRSVESSVSSPESVFSDYAGNTSRSRSSSISSTSSLEPLRSLRLENKAITHPSPLGRSCFSASRAPDGDSSIVRACTLPTDQPSHLSVTPKRTQPGGCAKRKSESASLSSDMPAETLVILSGKRGELCLGSAAAEDQMLSAKKGSRKHRKDSVKPPNPRHTSERIKAQRKLERETKRLLKPGHAFPDAVPEDSRQSVDYARVPEEEKKWRSLHHVEDEAVVLEDKENQVGNASWAGSRKPLCTKTNCNKRVAADLAAPDEAASMLRSELLMDTELITVSC